LGQVRPHDGHAPQLTEPDGSAQPGHRFIAPMK
jgi:hypothetical protein